MLDVHLGGKRPFGYNYWPLPEDDPGVEIPRESIRLVSPDGALVRGVLWTPPVACGLLNGTLRDELVTTGVLQERVLKREDLARAETIWWVNGLRGWVEVRPVRQDVIELAA